MNGILNATKTALGIPLEVTDFDGQLVMFINTALTTMHQIGFGPDEAYQITLTDGDMEDFLPDDESVRDMAQLYITLKTRVLFDPPASAAVQTAMQQAISEQEFRLQVHGRAADE